MCLVIQQMLFYSLLLAVGSPSSNNQQSAYCLSIPINSVKCTDHSPCMPSLSKPIAVHAIMHRAIQLEHRI